MFFFLSQKNLQTSSFEKRSSYVALLHVLPIGLQSPLASPHPRKNGEDKRTYFNTCGGKERNKFCNLASPPNGSGQFNNEPFRTISLYTRALVTQANKKSSYKQSNQHVTISYLDSANQVGYGSYISISFVYLNVL